MAIKKDNYITPKGFAKLEEELNFLMKTERPEITETVKWAASLGDRSENADYQYGKKRLREIDRRIRFLNTRINAALIVDPLSVTTDKIQFGATVTLEDENGKEKKYSIVGVDEVDTTKGYVSWKSPIARAMIGKEEGDEVIVQAPGDDFEYTIIEINYIDIEV
ncbi:transcription elongation factor GreB [Halobacteriovorax sp. XZX-3]|uniref:transcription elongation factor GreB n=1 Tax=unclassified Halobacteriovorax TaxID=2639665 RepID=UPI000CD2D8AD|nr:transcription elongation factor GreB [Halobacteriovorax sp. DA5]POB12459.1 transcription elongation factor GreB [Halobacteriovorax sp. DA5]